jgi:hypothetical protein
MVQEFLLFAIGVLHLRDKKGYDKVIIAIGEESLEPLIDDAMTLSTRPSVGIMRTKGCLSFIEAQMMSRESGFLRDYPFDISQRWTGDKISLVIAGVKSKAMHAMRGLSTQSRDARTVLRGYTSVHIHLDLLEISRIGLTLLLTIFAEMVASDALGMILLTHGQSIRSLLPLLGGGYADMLASGLADYVSHPLLRDDEEIQRLGLVCSPSYYDRTVFRNRLCHEVIRRAAILLTSPRSRIGDSQIILFESDPPTCLVDAIELAVAKALYSTHLRGSLTIERAREYYTDLDDRLRGLNRELGVTVLEAQTTLYDLAYALQRSNMPYVAEQIADIASGKVLATIDCSADEAVRLARSIPTRKRIENDLCSGLQCASRPVFFSVGGWGLRIGHRVRPSARIELEAVKGKPYKMGSRALGVWYAAREILVGIQTCCIVGSGLGAVASVLLQTGCTYVYGHDLQSDMPTDLDHRLKYVAPLVAQSNLVHRYAQTTTSFETSGDWNDRNVAFKTFQSVSHVDTFVFDHLNRDRDNSSHLSCVLMLQEIGFAGEIIVRLSSTYDECTLYAADMTSVMIVTSAIYVGAQEYGSVVVRGRLHSDPNPRHALFLQNFCLSSVSMADCDMIMDVDFYLAMISGTTRAVLFNTPEARRAALVDLHRDRGKTERSPDYRRWSDTLLSMVALEWLELDTDENRLEWLEQDELALGSRSDRGTFFTPNTKLYVDYLLRYAAPLLR